MSGMKIQKTGPASIVLVLESAEATHEDLRKRALEALQREGISARGIPQLTAYTAGNQTVVFVMAEGDAYTYFGFACADDLMDAATEVGTLMPHADAMLCRAGGQLYLATANHGAGELLREYASVVSAEPEGCHDADMLIPSDAFNILSGKC
jgi:hypothetical protein